jgi:hypothetical protein
MFILKTTETACATFLANVGTLPAGTNIYTGLDNEEREAPCVVCSALDGREEAPGLGIWHVRLAVTVKEIAYDTAPTSSLCGTVFTALLSDTLETDLTNSVTQYAVIEVIPEDTSNGVDGDAWTQTLTMNVVCSLTN